MDFELSPDLKMLRATVRRFVDRELIPIAMRVNQHEDISDDALRPLQEKIKAMGLWLLDVPKEHGGTSLSMAHIRGQEHCKRALEVAAAGGTMRS